MSVTIPASHRDLLNTAIHGVLTTMMPDGTPQSSVVWVDCDGEFVLINTTVERQKGRNMLANPKVTLLVIDPKDASRWIQLQGRVREMTAAGAVAHADRLTRRYTAKRNFYGDIYAVDRQQKETRVLVKIEPIKVTLDAIFRSGRDTRQTVAERELV
jgi:PPOX class probable F420-dependent enzyme